MSAVFQYELFKIQKCALVGNLLSDLDKSFPSIFGSETCTIRALCVMYQVFDLEYLFEDRRCQDLRRRSVGGEKNANGRLDAPPFEW